jgi:charged multivesicular body protein 6
MERELQVAKEQLKLERHHAARLALSKKKFQERLLEKTYNQLNTIEEMVSTIEFSQIEQTILKSLESGANVLKEIQNEMSLEKIDKIMDDTAEAIQYQKDIQQMISMNLSPQDEEDILAQLELIQEVQYINAG